ncbi:FmdB family zinc ribbon protein [Endomicrobium proavitum]|uniref:Putative regulatory protein, FmdB family (Modular protein) n=1 Tax=Endomicrobium proavitum TaxID=1408281 RepID=A0A0G3WJQ6_9BACT|nr:FmdB family zinc ribbon protein [Endomicrobium proavitum]AKL98518.1 putative regulatory protein, FmdB family (modular protein) [Endomicrobium proavitum]
MPLFEFVCNKCNRKFETLVLSGDEKIECPECKNGEVTKQFSLFSAASNAAPSCGTADYCPSKTKHKCSGGCCR